MATTLLAFDTSADELHAGLLVGDRPIGRSEPGGARASGRLVPMLRELLHDAGLGFADVQAFAFGRGPGAFTGLRVACAVAQGLGLGTGRPVLPLDSLQLVAEDDAATGRGPVWVTVDARMDEIYAACYARQADGGWQTRVEPALYGLDALHARWGAEPPQRVAGSALPAFGARLHTGTAERLPRGGDRAGALLRLARRAWDAGQAVDAAQALPLYLRDKVALTTAERAALAATRT